MNPVTPMPATSATDPGTAAGGTAAANPGDQVSGNEFLSLLTAELKNQDPTNPMDPTQFVSQLVQFNSLEQLISINQELAPVSAASSNPSAPAQS